MKSVSLKDVATLSPRCPRSELDPSAKASFIPMAAVSDKEYRIIDEQERQISEVMKGFTYFENDDVLLAKITPCFENGKIAIANLSNSVGFGTTEFHVIRSGAELFNKYIYYYLRQPSFLHEGAQNMTGSAGQKRVPKAFLETLSIPLPPLPEQKRIAAILDKADELRRKQERALELCDEFLKATFIDMFGDPVDSDKYKLEELRGYIKLTGGYAFKSKEFVEAGIPVVKIGTVNKGYFDFSNISYMPDSTENDHERFKVYPNDLLMSLTGTVGKDDYGNPCMASDEFDFYFLNQRVAKIEWNDEELTREFLYYLFKNEKVKNKIIGISRGVRQANISNEDLYGLKVGIPDHKAQKVFSKIVVSIDNRKREISRSFDKLKENFNALSQKAFKGEL